MLLRKEALNGAERKTNSLRLSELEIQAQSYQRRLAGLF